MELGPENTLLAQKRKNKRLVIVDAKNWGRFAPATIQKEAGFRWGGSRGVPKTDRGKFLSDKTSILQDIKPTIQPIEVGYANGPQRGVCGVCP